jgi:hypothetical protein
VGAVTKAMVGRENPESGRVPFCHESVEKKSSMNTFVIYVVGAYDHDMD